MLVKKEYFKRYRQQQAQYFHFATLCNGNLLFSVAILMCLITNGIPKTSAVPTDSLNGGARTQLLQRALRDVTAIASSFMQDESKNAAATSASAGVVVAASPLTAPSSVSAATALSSNLNDATATSSSSSSVVQPKGLCLLDGNLVAEPTVFCEKQIGCRAIQRNGHCCPDYKCDCEKDGKTYTNGDKLVDPENPCTVCYCQGGEILCSSVTCFHRDDCTPKYIPGRCCPEYDNCPVSNPEPHNTTTTSNKTLNNEFKSELQGGGALNPKITIKEITKPIEIRITDENKAISIHQMLKPSTTEATTTTTAAAGGQQETFTTATVISKPILTTPTTTSNNTISLATSEGGNTASILQQSNDNLSNISTAEERFSVDANLQNTKSNIHHANNSSHKKSPLLLSHNNESLKLSASVAYPTAASASGLSPSVPRINGVANTQEMHEIVAVGSNQTGSEKVPFADFGTQGLQRVDAAEGGEVNNNKVNIKREFLDTTTAAAADDITTADVVYTNVDNSSGHPTNLQSSSAEAAADPDTAGSDNIYRIILTTDGPRRSTEKYPANKAADLTGGLQTSFKSSSEDGGSSDRSQGIEEISSGQLSSSSSAAPPTSTTPTSNHSKSQEVSSVNVDSSTLAAARFTPTTGTNQASSTEGGAHLHQHHTGADDDDGAIPVESNPAYPSLPEDDFSLRDVNFPLSEGEELVDEPRSIGGSGGGVGAPASGTAGGSGSGSYDAFKRIADRDDAYLNTSGSGSGDNDAGVPPIKSSTESSASSPKIPLMYSTEDVSQETAVVSNANDFHPSSSGRRGGSGAAGVISASVEDSLKESENESGSGESLEIDSVELLVSGGSGAGSAADLTSNASKSTTKQREPTTPRPTKQPETSDIDELGSADEEPKSPGEDPKLEVESLKVNDNEEDGVAQQEAVPKTGNILAIKTKEGSERTVLEKQEVEQREVAVGVADRVQRLFLQRVY